MKSIFNTLIIIFLIFSSSFLYAQQRNGRAEGTIKDVGTGEVLPFATVSFVGTTTGALSNDKGLYSLGNKPGTYKMKISYVGYTDTIVDVYIKDNEVTVKNIALIFASTMGEEVIITAQAYGQIKAINTQITSKTIKNVVSEQKIRELPDANAAEALARLPGVSVNREGGEATGISIRGTGSNTVYVNGMRMDGGLGSISSSMIGGIELSKAFMPDQDADVLGGSVEFKMRDAPSGFKKEISLRQGYDAFTKSFKNQNVDLLLSNRFFKDKLGVMFSFSYDSKDRSRDILAADYESVGSSPDSEYLLPVKISSMTLTSSENQNNRYGLTIFTDYRLKNGRIYYQGFFSYLNADNKSSANSYGIGGLRYISDISTTTSQSILNGIGGEHTILGSVKIDWGVSLSQGKNKTPSGLMFTGINTSGMTGLGSVDTTTTITELMAHGKHDLTNSSASYLGVTDNATGYSDELGYKLNIEVPYKLGENIDGYVKFGAKIRDIDRAYDSNSRWSSFNTSSWFKLLLDAEERLPDYGWTHTPTGELGLEAFLGSQQTMDYSLLDSKLYFTPDYDKLKYIEGVLDDKLYPGLAGDANDYINQEQNYSTYIMTEVSIGDMITFTPGVRYEKTTYSTTAKWAQEVITYGPIETQGVIKDTTEGFHNEHFFPMVHLKIKPLKWFDIRMAYTQTVSRPSFKSMSPKYYRNMAFDINRGNVYLKPQSNTNYDIYLSFYGNKLGLFTAGAFYKVMENQIMGYTVRILDPKEYGLADAYKNKNYTMPINNQWAGYMQGVELDWQTQFAYLPKPFNGIILNANLTFMQSKTKYPYYAFKTETINVPPYRITTGKDSFRASTIIGMPDMVGNFALGYEVGGFSGRVSAYYQSSTITGAQAIDISTDVSKVALTRYDIQLSQKIKKFQGLILYLNINNLTNNHDKTVLTNYQNRTVNDQVYGASGDIGVRYRF